jgi:hypothetical protein
VWILVERCGSVGGAIAGGARAAAEALRVLFSAPVLWRAARAAALRTAALCVGAMLLLAGFMFLPDARTRLVVVAGIAVLWPAVAWFALVTPAERALLRSRPG